MDNPELLAPAGSIEALDAAVGEGADAVYLGLKTFNARMRTRNFAFNQFEAAVESLHKLGKRLYVTVNTVFEERESDRVYQLLQYLNRVGPDGVIVQDLGVVKLARDEFPALRLHASTQMNVASSPGVNVLSKLGFKRVVLARETSLDEIASVRKSTNLEIETFVHGALCVSCSGVCLFSSYLGGKSANRGACAQACRRLYEAEGSRSGYFFSPDDLELVTKVPELTEAGVDCFKIEGRMKSAEYVGAVVAAYRYMIDNWRHDRERAEAKAASLLQSDFARRKTLYWFRGKAEPDFIRADQAGGTGTPLGKIRKARAFEDEGPQWALVGSRDGVAEGDSVRVHSADDSGRVTGKIRGLKQTPEGLYLKIDCPFKVSDELYLIQTAESVKRYRRVLPDDLARYRKFPSWDRAPEPPRHKAPSSLRDDFPEGLYAMASRYADLHVLLSVRPVKAVVRLTRETARELRSHEKELPFRGKELVFWLEPWLAESDAAWLAEEIEFWRGKGFRHFIANNLGHLPMLRGKDLAIAAGPFLYAFNPYAAAFLHDAGCELIVPPLEFSKQNLMKIAESDDKRAFMVPVFAFPPLFTIRANLRDSHDFRFFTDRDGLTYELVSGDSGSVVVPANPFSLVDRVPFLRKEGFGRFLLDFSFIALKKPLYRQVMKAAEEGTVLPETRRFNWKDGFWTSDDEKKTAPAEETDVPLDEKPRAPRGSARDRRGSSEREGSRRTETRGSAGREGAGRAAARPARAESGRPRKPGSGDAGKTARGSDASRPPRAPRGAAESGRAVRGSRGSGGATRGDAGSKRTPKRPYKPRTAD